MPDDLTPIDTGNESTDARLSQWDIITRRKTAELATIVGGRLFPTEEVATEEGFELYLGHQPRATVFDVIGPELSDRLGRGNWGVTIPVTGENRTLSKNVVDVWAISHDQETQDEFVPPATTHALSLVIQKPTDYDIDK